MKTYHLTQPIGNRGAYFGVFLFYSSLFQFISFITIASFWPSIIFLAILISQILIILSWSDAKYGTILNLIFLFDRYRSNRKDSF